MTRCVALLRGINVGGRNLVAMADLRAAFEDAGYAGVSTYIQSGNVLFTSSARPAALEVEIETMLERRFGVPLVVIVRTRAQMRSIVTRAPKDFRAAPGKYHCDVVFLKAPLTAKNAVKGVELRDGVDRAWPGTGVVYFARLSARRTESRMSRIVSTPEYRKMSIRNWSTTTKLLDLLEQP